MDYRICCAMINFNFRPCVPDGENTTQIAKRIKNKCLKTKNQLLPLLNMSFTATIKSSDLKTIIGFPKLSHLVTNAKKLKKKPNIQNKRIL
jgi:hypothetical protein